MAFAGAATQSKGAGAGHGFDFFEQAHEPPKNRERMRVGAPRHWEIAASKRGSEGVSEFVHRFTEDDPVAGGRI